ncbi:MAG: alpha/beta hydrolase-fold protein [Lachnospiraceae bacterium]|nr:alpha/beta hydrolase-fold protein [Lachnospiraceae bacterium]
MAYIEFNALSTLLCGSFTARLFLPEMNKMFLDDTEHTVKYPVIYLLHDDGGLSADFIQTSAEKIADKYRCLVICPDVQHCCGTDMVYGPKYEKFLIEELPGICRNCFPASVDPSQVYIGGIGTGAYGALKTYFDHADCFAGALAIDGMVDMADFCRRARSPEGTGTYQNVRSLEAMFENIDQIEGSDKDLFTLSHQFPTKKVFLYSPKNSKRNEQNRRLAQDIKGEVKLIQEDLDGEGPRGYYSLLAAAEFLFKENC